MSNSAAPEAPTLSPEQELQAAFEADVAASQQDGGSTAPAAQASAEGAPASPDATSTDPPAAPAFVPFEIEWKGQRVTIDSREKAIEFAQKGYDYTQKTTAVAEERRQLQAAAAALVAARKAEQEALTRQLSDANFLMERLRALGHQLPQSAASSTPPAPEPDDFVDRQALQTELTRLKEEALNEARKEMQAELDRLEMARMQATFTADFDATIQDIITNKFPQLREIYDPDEATRLMRQEAKTLLHAHMTLNPDVPMDPAVLKNAMVSWAARAHARWESAKKQLEKDEAMKRAAAMAASPEPPGGGTPPQPAPQAFKSFKDPGLMRAAIDDVEAIIRGLTK